MSSPKHYLFALVDGGGTVPPELGAARRLLERGHRVTVIGEDTMREEVLAAGAAFRRWELGTNRPTRRAEDDPIKDWEVSSPLQLFKRVLDQQFIGPAAGYAADVDDAIRAVEPDVVVATLFGFGAMAAAERAGLPLVILHANIYPVPTPGRPAFGLGLPWPRGPLGRSRDRIVPALLMRMWDRQGRARFNAVRADLGLPPLAHFLDQLQVAERHLVLTSLAFDGPGHLPPSVVHTGPILDDPSWADAAWEPPVREGPLVLVGLSSTFQDQGALLQRIADALGGLPVRGLITTAPAIDPDSISAPANVSVVAAAPHAQVLRHAAVVVTHVGHGTLVKALAADVPVLVLPHGRDQADNAVRVVAAGAGLQLKRTARADRIATAVERLLDDPELGAAAATLGATLRADGASDALVRELESVPNDQPGVVSA